MSELLGFPKRLPEEILREVLGPDIFSVGRIINNLLRKRQHDFSNRQLQSSKNSDS